MKKLFYTIILSFFLTSCASSMKSPLMGVYYTDVKAPVTATSNVNSTKVGTAEAFSILGAVAIGDASIEEASKSAGISKIHHIDEHHTSVLGVFAKYKIYVYGE